MLYVNSNTEHGGSNMKIGKKIFSIFLAIILCLTQINFTSINAKEDGDNTDKVASEANLEGEVAYGSHEWAVAKYGEHTHTTSFTGGQSIQGNLFINTNITVNNTAAGGHGLRVTGETTMVFEDGASLAVTAGRGDGRTAGGTGIVLDKMFTLDGKGILNATGGQSGVATSGASGFHGYNDGDYFYVSGSAIGGNGGGAAGPGIGGISGSGGVGGSGANSYRLYADENFLRNGYHGASGSSGSSGGSINSNIIQKGNVVITATAGNASSTPGSGRVGGTGGYRKWNNTYSAGGGGGGGGGGYAAGVYEIGAGSGGGGGGGAGGGGNADWSASNFHRAFGGGGGGGGGGYGGAGGMGVTATNESSWVNGYPQPGGLMTGGARVTGAYKPGYEWDYAGNSGAGGNRGQGGGVSGSVYSTKLSGRTSTAASNGVGGRMAYYQVYPQDECELSITGSPTAKDGKTWKFTNANIQPTVKIVHKPTGTVLPTSAYKIGYTENKLGGQATITVTGAGLSTTRPNLGNAAMTGNGSLSTTFHITYDKDDLEIQYNDKLPTSVVGSPAYEFNGTAIEKGGVYFKGTTFEIPTDNYTLTYANNVDKGIQTANTKASATGANWASIDDEIVGEFSIIEKPTITITETKFDNIKKGNPYLFTFLANGTHEDPYVTTWSVTAGKLPVGVHLDEATGVISGTPTTKETTKATITASNAAGSDAKEFEWNVVSYFTLTYNSNGGNEHIPSSKQYYENNPLVNVNFDTIPERAFYKFAGWAKTATAVNATPEYTKEGTNTFTIDKDQTLYATWHSGSISSAEKSVNGIHTSVKYHVQFVGVPSTTTSYGIDINGKFYPADSVPENTDGSGSYDVTVTDLTASDTYTIDAKINNVIVPDVSMSDTMLEYSPDTIYFDGTTYEFTSVFGGLSVRYDEGAWSVLTDSEVGNEKLKKAEDFVAGTVRFYRAGNGVRPDSTIKVITLEKPAKPTVTVEQPTTVLGKGVIKDIPVNAEYSFDNGASWRADELTLSDLSQGSEILIRIKGGLNKLHSESEKVTIDIVKELKHTVTPYIATYDAAEHAGINIQVSDPATGAVIEYGTTPDNLGNTIPQVKEVGKTKIYYRISAVGYEEVKGSIESEITKAPLTITFENKEIVYGEAANIGYKIEGFQGADTQDVFTAPISYTSNPAIPDINKPEAGNYVITPKGAEAQNYEMSYVPGNLQVKEKEMVVTATPYEGVYDAIDHQIGVSVDVSDVKIRYGMEAGTYDLVDSPTFKKAGEYRVYYQVTKKNYKTVTASAVVKITKQSVTPSIASAQSKIYDGTLIGKGTIALAGIVNNEAISATGIFAYTSKDAGSKTFNVTSIVLSDSTNYVLTTDTLSGIEVTGGEITKKELKATYNKTIEYLAPFPTDVKIEGFVVGENSGNAEEYVAPTVSEPVPLAIGKNPVTPVGGSARNYSFKCEPGNLTVLPAEMEGSATNYEGIYDGTAHSGVLEITKPPVPNNLEYSYRKDEDATFTLTTPPTYTDVGVYTYWYKVHDTTGYFVDFEGSISVTIEKKEVAVEVDTIENKEYDKNASATGTLKIKDPVTGREINGVTARGQITFDEVNVGSNKRVSVSNITLDSASQRNYVLQTTAITAAASTAEITKKAITLQWSGHEERFYDGIASHVQVRSNDILSGDSVVLSVSGGQETKAGTHRATATLSGNDNYEIRSGGNTTSYSIKKVKLSASAKNQNIIYGASPDLSIDVTGFVNGEDSNKPADYIAPTVTMEPVPADQAKPAVGTYDLKVSGGAANNYEFEYTQGVLVVKDAAIQVTASGYNGIYDGQKHTIRVVADPADSTIVYSTDGVNYSTSNPEFKDVGTYKVKYKATRANYKEATGEETVVITAKDIDITLKPDSMTTREYDGSRDTTFTLESADIETQDVGNIVIKGTVQFTDKNVGANKAVDMRNLSISGSAAKNYRVKDTSKLNVVTTAEVTARNLTWKWNNAQEREYNGVASTVGISFSNVVGGDVVIAQVSGGDAKDVGTSYEARLDAISGADKDNYNIPVEGRVKKYSITPRMLTITWKNASTRIYNGQASNVYAQEDRVVAGESTGITTSGGVAINAGEHRATASITNPNYQMSSGDGEQEYKIEKVELLAAYAGETIKYGVNPGLKIMLSGFVNNEDETAIATKPAIVSGIQTDVGEWKLTPEGGMATNYNFKYQSGILKINGATIQVEAHDYINPYDGNKHGIEVKAEGSTIEYSVDGGVNYTSDNPTFQERL